MAAPQSRRSKPDDGALYDVDQVRRDARQSAGDGAVTRDYPLDLARARALLDEALGSEILCVLRYRHHQVIAKGLDRPQVADEFAEHADDEQRHMMLIAERIDQLGGNPEFNPGTVLSRASTEFGSSRALTEMIGEDLVAERVVIEIYRKLVKWFGNDDPTTRRMLEKILADEEDHASDLADMLAAIDPRSEPRP